MTPPRRREPRVSGEPTGHLTTGLLISNVMLQRIEGPGNTRRKRPEGGGAKNGDPHVFVELRDAAGSRDAHLIDPPIQ